MRTYKINGKKTPMPDGWHDVKYCDAINIIENNLNDTEIFGLFAKMSKKEVRELNGKDVRFFLDGFPFLKSLPIEDKPDIPISVNWKGSKLFFPHVMLNDEYDFGETSVGQVEDMKQVITSTTKQLIVEEDDKLTNLDMIRMMPMIVSIYIQPFINGSYDYKKALNVCEDLKKEMSFKEVCYIGNFFLIKLTGSINGLKKESLILKWIKRKLMQAYRILIKRLGFM